MTTNQAISAGNILFVEYPLIKIDHDTDPNMHIMTIMQEIHRTVEQDRVDDTEFSHVWNSIGFSHKMYMHHLKALMYAGLKDIPKTNLDPRLVDLIKVKSNQFGSGNIRWRQPWGVYGVLSKINFGLPQNIAVVFGGAEHNFVCVAFAVKDIAKGEELVGDYFYDWFDYDASKMSKDVIDGLMKRRENVGAFFGYNHSERMKKILDALGSDNKSQQKKYTIADRFIYPNGIVGKSSDQKELEVVAGGEENMLASKMQKLVNSKHLFQIIDGNVSVAIPEWIGQSFKEYAHLWKAYRMVKTRLKEQCSKHCN